MWQRGLRGVEHPLDVYVNHAVPFLGRRVLDGTEQHDAGVVEERVEPSELVHRLVHGNGGLVPDRNIGLDGEGLTAPFHDLCHKPVQPVLTTGRQSDRSAVACERSRRRLPDAA